MPNIETFNKALTDYFGLLKKTGESSSCEIRKLVITPLIMSMTSGDLSVWDKPDTHDIVVEFAKCI